MKRNIYPSIPFLLQTWLFAVAAQLLSAQTVPDGSWQWTWIKGHNTFANQGTYGTIGTADPANLPGGRSSAATWQDSTGNFWIFGGSGHGNSGSADLGDLWMYEHASNSWTWIHGDSAVNQPGVYGILGTPDPSNKPGSRSSAAYWKDTSGNFWIFGGWGKSSSATNSPNALNDLWKYDPAGNEWTWMGGSSNLNALSTYGTQGVPSTSNIPSARYGGAFWTDGNGHFWLFGGTGRYRTGNTNNSGELNDMWRYNPYTGEWTWMHGDTAGRHSGTFGTQGTAAAANMPPSISLGAFWTNAADELWLYGGMNYNNGTRAAYADMWMYSTTANQWTWVQGNAQINRAPVMGTMGTPSAANTPGFRDMSPATWKDQAGNLWLLGGEASGGTRNDLWKFDPSSGEWTWVKGDNTGTWTSLPGVYGTQGVGAAANKPGHRQFRSSTWVDRNGVLWLFGGRSGTSGRGDLSDLWRLAPECTMLHATGSIQGPDTICSGQEQLFTIAPVPGATSYIWITPQGWTTSSQANSIRLSASEEGGTLAVYAVNTCDTSDTLTKEIIIAAIPPLVITVNHDTLGTLYSYSRYQWYKDGQPIPGATQARLVVTENADYMVRVENETGCPDSSEYRIRSFIDRLGATGPDNISEDQLIIFPNPARNLLHIQSNETLHGTLQSMEGKSVVKIEDTAVPVVLEQLPPGIYLLSLYNKEGNKVHTQRISKVH